MHRATAELTASGQANRALRIGDRARTLFYRARTANRCPLPLCSRAGRWSSRSIAAYGARIATWSCRPCRRRCPASRQPAHRWLRSRRRTPPTAANRIGRFLPSEMRKCKTVLEWVYWQMGGLGPMLQTISGTDPAHPPAPARPPSRRSRLAGNHVHDQMETEFTIQRIQRSR